MVICLSSGYCNNLEFVGKTLSQHLTLVERNNSFSIKRKNVVYSITIETIGITKKITIAANNQVELIYIENLIFELLRFENIFDGKMYTCESLVIDGRELESHDINKYSLPYYKSKLHYAYLGITFDNPVYKRIFLRWIKLERDIGITHSMFLHSTYATEIPSDLKMALLLQVFEPLSDFLIRENVLTYNAQTYNRTCSKCGYVVVKTRSWTFAERLKAIVSKYGSVIFCKDSKAKIIKKAVKLRNKVIHVDNAKKGVKKGVKKGAKIGAKIGALNGNQCGFYVYKFSLLYRYIILTYLDINTSSLLPKIARYIEDINQQFPQCRILP